MGVRLVPMVLGDVGWFRRRLKTGVVTVTDKPGAVKKSAKKCWRC